MKFFFWLEPVSCDPPHGVSHPEKVQALADAFDRTGWGVSCPVLVGYPLDGRVQLLSGSHRWAAATHARIQIPVVIVPFADVEAAYGDLDAWRHIMQSGDRL